MRRTPFVLAALSALALLAATPLAAQTVDPGMSRDEVVRLLGKPTGERSTGTRTYLFFRNGCERSCGMHDLVVLEDGKVTDAIFRARGRSYSGASSSPAQVPPARARARLPQGARRGGIVQGSDAPGAAPAPARRPSTVRGVAGAAQPARAAAPADSAARDAARPRVQPGPVRVPVLPRDTQIGVQPRERGQRTLPGPVTVPTVPRDTQVARPDSTRKPRD